MSPYQLKSSEPAATSSDSPPPIVARPPSNRVTIAVPTNTAPSNIVTSPTLHSNRAVPPTPPHTLLLSNKELPDQIPNISPSNTEAPKLPSTRLPSKRVASVLSPTDSSSNRVTPPTLRNTTSPSNKETSNQLPITSPSNTEALKLPSTTSTLKRVTPPPPPPTSQSDIETQSLEVSGDKPPPLVSRSTKKWPPTESETVPASTPTRPTSKGVPPPVPTRKPSITPS
uniref:Uncharacterized protein n=2 Tax=Arion vulgaris TaxID=1028688 RepID=A0A0B7ARW4_9EUPU